jgi:hypothetical protein
LGLVLEIIQGLDNVVRNISHSRSMRQASRTISGKLLI